MQYKAPKGLFDILPHLETEDDAWKDSCKWQFLEQAIQHLARDYQCLEIRTPMFEPTDLFVRSSGETSDIVSKEMYTFLDKAQRSLTLRPEGTASSIRAFIEHGMEKLRPLNRLYCIGPMFRYDRPQAGRYRQFHQFSVEIIGSSLPETDVEAIDMMVELYRRLHIKNTKLLVNTIGDFETKETYQKALKHYFELHASHLSADSQVRLEKNVLRILDSKSEQDRELVENAPKIYEFLTPKAKDHFHKVCSLLSSLNIPWEISPFLVRGLDYYCHTVFEVVTSELGSQSALGGGGRYDGLIQALGGPHLPAVGFASGLERILQVMLKQNFPFPSSEPPFVFFIALGEDASKKSMELVSKLRHANIPALADFSQKKLSHILQIADESRAKYVIVLGDRELASNELSLKEMSTKKTTPLTMDALMQTLVGLHQPNKVLYD